MSNQRSLNFYNKVLKNILISKYNYVDINSIIDINSVKVNISPYKKTKKNFLISAFILFLITGGIGQFNKFYKKKNFLKFKSLFYILKDKKDNFNFLEYIIRCVPLIKSGCLLRYLPQQSIFCIEIKSLQYFPSIQFFLETLENYQQIELFLNAKIEINFNKQSKNEFLFLLNFLEIYPKTKYF